MNTPRGSFLALLMFFVVAAYRNARVTALAKRHEVALVVRTAACQRQDVMHFFGGRQPAFLFALFAQRMRLDIARANPTPRAPVSLFGIGIALVFVVMTHGDLSMFVAVPTVGQPAATWIGARTFGVSRH